MARKCRIVVKFRYDKLNFKISKEYKFMFREKHAVTTGEYNYHYSFSIFGCAQNSVLIYLG